MRIVHLVLGKANPNRMNGVNAVVHEMASHQVRGGQSAMVWGVTPTPEVGVSEREYPIRLFRYSGIRPKLARDLEGALLQLGREVVVHLHGGLITEWAKVGRILRRRGIPYILTSHGAYNKRALRKNCVIKRLYVSLIERHLVGGAAALHCVGRTEMENAARIFPGARCVLLPNGQATPPAALGPSSEERVPRPLFGYCGRLEFYEKGLDLLAEGYVQYKKQGGAGSLWIIGDGPGIKKLRSSLRSVDRSIRFLGPLFGAEKVAAISNFDAFCYLSRWEGFPMAPLEAAALGKPLIVSRETNLGEYVELNRAGIVLGALAPEDVARAFKEFERGTTVGDPKTMGLCARKMIESRLNWTLIVDEFMETYRAALSPQATDAG